MAGKVMILDAVRTPFGREGGALAHLSAVDLGASVVAELIARVGLDPAAVDRMVFGRVIPSLDVHNIAREVVLAAGLPPEIEGVSVSEACITGYRAVASATDAIAQRAIDCAVAGGVDSASGAPIAVSQELAGTIKKERRAKGLIDHLKALKDLRPSDLVPVAPTRTERSTGLSMGESTEKMAQINGISREAQDVFAHESHVKAAQAWDRGFFADHVMAMSVPPDPRSIVERDENVRFDSDPSAYPKLKPVFAKDGTITAGSSTPMSDGASALLLASEEKAAALGLEPRGWLRAFSFLAVDPTDQLLIGPVRAIPDVLARAGVALEEIDVLDVHEAFAAQVLSVLRAFDDDDFARRFGLKRAIGEYARDRINPSGGSIALGHPFAATGARQIMQTLHELEQKDGRLGLCTACGAGGLAAAIVVERSER